MYDAGRLYRSEYRLNNTVVYHYTILYNTILCLFKYTYSPVPISPHRILEGPSSSDPSAWPAAGPSLSLSQENSLTLLDDLRRPYPFPSNIPISTASVSILPPREGSVYRHAPRLYKGRPFAHLPGLFSLCAHCIFTAGKSPLFPPPSPSFREQMLTMIIQTASQVYFLHQTVKLRSETQALDDCSAHFKSHFQSINIQLFARDFIVSAMSSRSRAVLDKLAARAALQSSQPAAGIRNRPAMPTITSSARSSASTGRSQPVLSIRSQKAALQARQAVPTSGPTDELRAKARSLCEAAQARRDRQATAAAPVTVKKAEVVVEACGVGRKPHSSREDSASLQKQGKPSPTLSSTLALPPIHLADAGCSSSSSSTVESASTHD